ncbi:MAG: U32 family peptidase, partial [Kiritimatiellae bacterium]|nr:U32 family peptidase [Kiritimatiellia bacterium]
MAAHLPELLAPAGSPAAAFAAFEYGADAVYAGLSRFSARAEAENFDAARLRELVAFARSLPRQRKVYVAVNTLVGDADFPALAETLEAVESAEPDGVIVQDLGAAAAIRREFPSLALHASTQMAAHSAEGVRALRDLGFSRVVLARECTLEETARAVREGGAEIEIFVHGALCHSVSGLCLFSALEKGRSGNRGRCAYCCRLQRGTLFPHSMKDLCLAPLIDRVVATGAASLKIEGRMKGPLYVACATALYRALLDGLRDPEKIKELEDDLRSVFARDWTSLYALGREAPVSSTSDPHSLGHRGAPIGTVSRVVPPDSRNPGGRLVFRT